MKHLREWRIFNPLLLGKKLSTSQKIEEWKKYLADGERYLSEVQNTLDGEKKLLRRVGGGKKEEEEIKKLRIQLAQKDRLINRLLGRLKRRTKKEAGKQGRKPFIRVQTDHGKVQAKWVFGDTYETPNGTRYVVKENIAFAVDEKEEGDLWELTYNEVQGYDEDTNNEKTGLREIFHAKTEEEAERKAAKFLDAEKQKEDYGLVWVKSREKVSLKKDMKTQPVNLKKSKMRGVVQPDIPMGNMHKKMSYGLLDCEENYLENDTNCVIRYLINRFLLYTQNYTTEEGKKIKAKMKVCFGNPEFYTRFFNTIRKEWYDPENFEIDWKKEELREPILDGIAPWEIQQLCEIYGISHTCISTLGEKIFYYSAPKQQYPMICYITNGEHLYPLGEEARKKVGGNGRFRKMVREDEEVEKDFEYSIVENLEDAGLTGYVFIESSSNFNEYILEMMKDEGKVYPSSCYKADPEGNIVEFSPYKDLTLKAYPDVGITIMVCEKTGIKFTGQSLNAVGLDLLQFDEEEIIVKKRKLKTSVLNAQTYNLLVKNNCKGGISFIKELPKSDNLIGYDIVKCYPSILEKDQKLPLFDEFCELEPFQYERNDEGLAKEPELQDDFLYKVERCENTFPLSCDGVYYGFLLKYCQARGIKFWITEVLKHRGKYHYPFTNDIQRLFSLLGEDIVTEKYGKINLFKKVINSMIGIMGKKRMKETRIYYDHSIVNAGTIVMRNMQNGMVLPLSTNPDIYEIKQVKENIQFETNLPTYTWIIQKAWMKVHLLSEKMKGRLIRVHVDCIIVENGVRLEEKEIGEKPGMYREISKEKCLKSLEGKKVSVIKDRKVKPNRDDIRKLRELKVVEWRDIEIEEEKFREDGWGMKIAEKIYEARSCFIKGIAGTGKSTLYKSLEAFLKERGKVLKKLAFTNNAASNIEGKTLHKSFYLSACRDLGEANLRDFGKGDWVFIDEISLVHSSWYRIFLRLKERGCFLIIAGDFQQLEAVGESYTGDFENTVILRQLCDSNRIWLKINKRSDDTMFKLYERILKLDETVIESFQWTDELPREDEIHITLLNKTRESINRYLMKKGGRSKEIIRFNRDENKEIPMMILWEGSPLESWKGNLRLNVINGRRFRVKNWDDDCIRVIDEKNGEEIEVEREIFNLYFRSGFATTCHRAQGNTLTGKIRIWDSGHKYATEKWLYTAVSRTIDWKNIRFSSSAKTRTDEEGFFARV